MEESKSWFTYPFARPSLTADAVVWTIEDGKWKVLLIQRGSEPFAGRWALPGGFVEPDEPTDKAAARELKEEAGVEATDLSIVGCFGGPNRDPRGWTASAAYYCFVKPGTEAMAGSDAKTFAWHPMKKLPSLAFDHAEILKEARGRLLIDCVSLPIFAPLLPAKFSWKDVASVYQTIDARKFQHPTTLKRRLIAADVISISNKVCKWKRRTSR